MNDCIFLLPPKVLDSLKNKVKIFLKDIKVLQDQTSAYMAQALPAQLPFTYPIMQKLLSYYFVICL